MEITKWQMEEMEQRAALHMGNTQRMGRCIQKARRGENLVIGMIGGSVTMGSASSDPGLCYAFQVYRHWQERFPNTEISYVNAGIGGTDSHFGAARAEKHLLSKRPDFVIVEFSVNDRKEEYFAETYESLLRNILFSENKPAVMAVNMVKYDTGDNVQDMHNEVARYYDLPVISMKEGIWEEIRAGRIGEEEITADHLHPNDAGHSLIAALINRFLDGLWKRAEQKAQTEYRLPGRPLTPNRFEPVLYYQNDTGESGIMVSLNGFERDTRVQDGICDLFKRGWQAKREGDSISFQVKGKNIAAQYRRTVHRPAPTAVAYVDGEETAFLNGNFDEDWGDSLAITNVLRNGGDQTHTVKIVIHNAPGEAAATFYLAALIVA